MVKSFLILLTIFTANIHAQNELQLKANIEKLKKTKSCENCNLVHANLSSLDLSDAVLTGAKLVYVNFNKSELMNVQLNKSELVSVSFNGLSLKYTNLEGSHIEVVSFQKADLTFANFRGAEIIDTSFEDADLRRADFRGAKFRAVNFKNAKLEGALFDGNCPKDASCNGPVTVNQYFWLRDPMKLGKAKKLLTERVTFIEHCQPCQNAKPTSCRVEVAKNVLIEAAGDGVNYRLLVNGRQVDLAYIYVANKHIRKGRFTNIAQKVGLETKSVPRSLIPEECTLFGDRLDRFDDNRGNPPEDDE